MAQEDFYLNQGDTSPSIQGTCKDSAGVVVDVTGAGIKFSMTNLAKRTVKVQLATATIVDGTNGIIKYNQSAGDVDEPGDYLCKWQVTFVGGLIQTYPNNNANPFVLHISREAG